MAIGKFQGGCHCGAVRFEVELDLDQAISCNCSICTKGGFIWGFVALGNFVQTAGEASTTVYRFHKHLVNHRFCSRCGIEAFATGTAPDGHAMAAINLRCIDNIDLTKLSPRPVDGRSL